MPDFPEGLTREDAMNGIVRITEPTDTVDVEPGATITGEITDTDVSAYEVNDDEVYYFNLTIELDDVPFDLNESWSMNELKTNEGTSLGTIVDRFVDGGLEGFGREEDMELSDVFEGEEVEFEIAEDEEGYNAVADDIDGMPTLRPEGEELDVDIVEHQGEESGSSDDESGSSDDSDEEDSSSDEDSESAVLEIVAENEGEDESTVKKELAQESGSYVKAYSELVDEGTIVVEDGEVSL